ncbi:Gfo/Idh/MocA family oxidoreductase [Candidatus Aerophobetes bacterium]|nr:Gfo/Idh/MocA family oxidoreductase [Candidatus Aerophobetes bacterium]
MPGDKDLIKVGIAGLGRSGWNIHAQLLQSLPDMYKIVSVCDPDESRREEAFNKFSCDTYTNFEDFLKNKEVELVIVATPNHLHSTHSIKALEAGKAVVCEKPMATNLDDADNMIRVAKETGSLLTVFQNRRYSPDFLKVRQVIQSGKLGRIVMIKMAYHSFSRRWDWQTLKEFGGGTLNNTGPHPIDQALQLFGEKEPEIFCDLKKTLTLGDAEDHVKIIMRAQDAPMIDLEITSACAYPQKKWLVMGTQGGLKGTMNTLQWKYFNPEDLPRRKVERRPTPDRSYNQEKIPWKEEFWDIHQDKSPGQLGFYLDLYKTMRKGASLSITPESARRVMWVIEKCHQLANRRKP